jgi:2-polyprenyl-6-methoxyphenol hydroxylase-like FAD-dependent oxidoreductase
MSPNIPLLSIGIVGAGIGGLAAASLCARAGHHVTLIERFVTPRALGSGLVLQPIGLAVLDAIGADARPFGAPITQMLGFANRRKVLDVAYKPDAPGLAIHRASLFAVLWEAARAAGITLQTGSTCTSAPLTRGKRLIERENGAPLGPFDLVIDASGAGSQLSPLKARPLGYGAIWGTVPWPHDTDLPGNHLTQRYQAGRRMAGVLPIGRLPDNTTPQAAVFWSLPRAKLDDWPQQDLGQWKAEVTQLWP